MALFNKCLFSSKLHHSEMLHLCPHRGIKAKSFYEECPRGDLALDDLSLTLTQFLEGDSYEDYMFLTSLPPLLPPLPRDVTKADPITPKMIFSYVVCPPLLSPLKKKSKSLKRKCPEPESPHVTLGDIFSDCDVTKVLDLLTPLPPSPKKRKIQTLRRRLMELV